MHSSTSADAASRWARRSAAWGRYSPNSTTSGLSTAPQSHRGILLGIARVPGADLGDRIPGAAVQADRMRDRAVHLDQLGRSRPRVQAVDVLRDHRVEQSRPLELRERLVGAIRLLVLERLEALAVEAPELARDPGGRRRCAPPPSGRRSPTARSRASGSRGSPTGPRSRRRSARRPSRPRGSARRARRGGPSSARSPAHSSREVSACASSGTPRSPRERPSDLNAVTKRASRPRFRRRDLRRPTHA